MSDRDLLDEQVAYYRARAAEYDATSIPDGDPFASHAEAMASSIRVFAPLGRTIEIAAGTGQWTELLADMANDLLVTDASPEMLEINRAKTGERTNVRYAVADAFRLDATHAHDTVFFGFFLSHVPPGRLEPFWAIVDGLLAPGGRVLFVDEADHGLWEEDWIDREAGVVRRRRTDGTTHRAVKVLWDPVDLERRLAELGWDASVRAEGPFYWGTARRR